jgi:hypothetical protein
MSSIGTELEQRTNGSSNMMRQQRILVPLACMRWYISLPLCLRHGTQRNGWSGCDLSCVGYIEPQTPTDEPTDSRIIHRTTILKSDHQVETVKMTGICT